MCFQPGVNALISSSWDGTIRFWKSELTRLCRKPVSDTRPDDLAWVQDALYNPKVTGDERQWLEFLRALMRWRRRHDIHVTEEVAMEIGEFDIEIEI